MTTELRRAQTPDNLEFVKRIDYYTRWQESEGVKVIGGYVFEDLNTVELGPWERKGGKGAIINMPNPAMPNDAHLVEIKPGGKSEPEHHMYEETTYVLSGRGATSVYIDEKHTQTFEWEAGSLFVIPLNAWYQHFNGNGSEPARYVSMTNAPPTMRTWKSDEFIFNNPFHFTDRFSGSDESFFNGEGRLFGRRGEHVNTVWRAGFVPKADTMPLWDHKHRGAGGIHTNFDFAGNVTNAHMSEFPVGTYKKAHRHGPGAHLIILGGMGFSLLWWEGQERLRANWKRGSMVVVPADETFHQHFNTGPEPARYLALRPASAETRGAGGKDYEHAPPQIEYEDEAREIHKMFESELSKHGALCRMKAFIPWCTGEIGPLSERDT